jgi:succinyl-CoA synthetase alpha subunit
MSILVSKDTRLIVQGFTGSQGTCIQNNQFNMEQTS